MIVLEKIYWGYLPNRQIKLEEEAIYKNGASSKYAVMTKLFPL